MRTLQSLGAEATAAIPHLLKILKDEDWRVRNDAILALRAIGSTDKTVVKALMDTVKNKGPAQVRATAALALGYKGPHAKDATSLLREVLRMPGEQDPELADSLRCSAVKGLHSIGAAAKDAIPDLIGILKNMSMSPVVRAEAAKTLGDLGAAAKIAIPILQKARQDPDRGVADAVTEALAKLDGTLWKSELEK
jgi:HEAT repeat protein